MGLSVAIAGGIVMVTIMLIMLSIPTVVDTIFSIGEISSQSSKINDLVSKTNINIPELYTSAASPRVNFTLTNEGSTTLWNFNKFNVLVEYTGAVSGKKTEQLTYAGSCVGLAAGQWCVQSILNDIADPNLLNSGEKANIRTRLNENLANTLAIVTVATDNGVIFKTGNPSCGTGIPLPTCKKSGWFMPASATDDALGGFGGILTDITSDGAQAYGNDADGARWSTPVTAVASTDGGIQSANALNFRAEWDIKLIAKVQQSATSSHRIFVGFREGATLPNSDTICGAAVGGDACAGFVIDSNDLAWEIVTNDGDAVDTRTACTAGCTDDTLVHTLQVRSDAANNRWGFIWDDQAEQFVSVDLPPTGLNLFADVEMESTGTNNSIEIYYIYVETDK